ncbi:hypothetical protein [Pseudomonas sp. microsymbiont 2]
MHHTHYRRLATCCFPGLIWAFLISPGASAGATESSDQALQQRMTLCQSRLDGLERLMIERIESAEHRLGGQLQSRPELERQARMAQRKLQEARALYGDPPSRPEHRLYIQGLQSEIVNLRRVLGIIEDDERTVTVVRPYLRATLERRQDNAQRLDDFDYAVQECGSWPRDIGQCHAQNVQPLRKPLNGALSASHRLLYDAWPALRNQQVRYPSSWENDCVLSSR